MLINREVYFRLSVVVVYFVSGVSGVKVVFWSLDFKGYLVSVLYDDNLMLARDL